MFTFTKIFFPGLPNLRTQIRYVQNRYTAVQANLKYPLHCHCQGRDSSRQLGKLSKTIRVKKNTNECFDGKIAEKITAQDKLFRKSQKSKLSVDEMLYKEAKDTVQVLIKDKKRKLLQEKLSESIGKPKELWKIIKELGLPDKKAPTGVDNLTGRFLKDGSNTVCTPIAKICNISIKLASFPDKCKVAEIKL